MPELIAGVMLMFIFGFYSFNIYKVIKTFEFDSGSPVFWARVVGIFIMPLGVIMGLVPAPDAPAANSQPTQEG